MTGWIYVQMKTKLATAEQKPEDGSQKMNGLLGIIVSVERQRSGAWAVALALKMKRHAFFLTLEEVSRRAGGAEWAQINYLQIFSSRNNWHTGWTRCPIVYSMTLNFMWFRSLPPAHCFMAKHFLYLHLYSIPFFTSPGGLTAIKLSWQKPPHLSSDSFRGQRS